MIVNVVFFAKAKEIVGKPKMEVALDDEANIGDLKQTLVETFPAIYDLLSASMISVDRQYASDDTNLYHGVEVVIIPPVSGG